eukprot:CAMPEP_0198370586 /NCGR_PEP_ID=MMETSP1450-20131203/156789_1 /TAXON_ID=753684 ORGANISM="Madagascaria erythrocladiodes, Strain CCMP3234" /NCGR_SAMPLE_ID=MMETSP1450 /ASSEMBLY_ACC=CAM_ASM_001115 /LENGTH=636 /DNA_ID=CAMNT_0044078127 /DNA_START=566 /DNA_END=2476 /DNA_ORIENTATION=+
MRLAFVISLALGPPPGVLHGSAHSRRRLRACCRRRRATVASAASEHSLPGTDSGALVQTRPASVHLASLALREWRTLLPGVVCLLVATLAGLLTPGFFGSVFDSVAAPDARAHLRRAIAALSVLYAAEAFFAAFETMFLAAAGERLLSRIRTRVFGNLLTRDMAFHDSAQPGVLLSRLSADTRVSRNIVTVDLPALVRATMATVGSFVGCYITSRQLTAVVSIIIPFSVFVASTISRPLKRLAKEMSDEQATATTVAEEAITGMRVVRSFTRAPATLDKYTGVVKRVQDIGDRKGFLNGLLNGCTRLGGHIVALAALGLGGRLAIRGVMTVGKVMSFVIFSFRLTNVLAQLVSGVATLAENLGSIQRTVELLDVSEHERGRSNRQLGSFRGDMQLRNVFFAYSSRPEVLVLKDVSLTIPAGSSVALCGQSGSGKSTLSSLIQMFYRPTRGQLYLDGVDSSVLDPDWVRSKVSVVEQNPLLFTGTIAENIAYGDPDATDEDIEAAAREAGCHDFISALPDGYNTKLTGKGNNLSGGQKQRISFARALIKPHRILILDEPTSALDKESEAVINETVERLTAKPKRTLLLIAHKLETVRNFDRIVVFANGRIVESGTHDELHGRQDGVYRRMLNLSTTA